MRAHTLVTTVVLAFAPHMVAHGQAPQAAVALYSGLCYHELGGDILGDRVFLIDAFNSYDVVYQPAPGWPQRPWTGVAKITGNQIQFDVKSSKGETESFSGTINSEEIVGSFANDRTDNRGNKIDHWRRWPVDNPKVPKC